jgi:hypothetical protein
MGRGGGGFTSSNPSSVYFAADKESQGNHWAWARGRAIEKKGTDENKLVLLTYEGG